MRILNIFLFAVILIFLFSDCSINIKAESEIFIRLNQVGFQTTEFKSCVIFSNSNLDSYKAVLKEVRNNKIIFTAAIDNRNKNFSSYKYTYTVDFSQVQTTGEYFLEIADQKSNTFKISDKVYNDIAASLLDFFRIQRCGYTDPFMHEVCHIADATSIINGKNEQSKIIDVTGGWHDAGDYVKFLNTTAFATYMLLFSYDFDPTKFGFDNNKNSTPDILEEAKIGLDWLLRCNYEQDKLITQLQNLKDHEVGWRLPEEDQLQYERPAYVGIGKNLIGIYTAALALGARIWRDKFYYTEFSSKCLQTAEKFYRIRNRVADIDSSGTGMYIDKSFNGKLALGAIELFNTTNNNNYLIDAKNYADSAKSDFWWSWGDVNSLAHFRISTYDSKYQEFIRNNLVEFNNKKNDNLFNKGVHPTWGTNSTLLGITLQNILWKRLTGDSSFDSLAVLQKDYVLGRNPWGVSFIYKYGNNFTQNFHHQISYLKGKLPGGFAAGPATKEFVSSYKIPYEATDKYLKFQSDNAYYRDDRMDYITNEPTITGNATAIFVFGNLAK